MKFIIRKLKWCKQNLTSQNGKGGIRKEFSRTVPRWLSNFKQYLTRNYLQINQKNNKYFLIVKTKSKCCKKSLKNWEMPLKMLSNLEVFIIFLKNVHYFSQFTILIHQIYKILFVHQLMSTLINLQKNNSSIFYLWILNQENMMNFRIKCKKRVALNNNTGINLNSYLVSLTLLVAVL